MRIAHFSREEFLRERWNYNPGEHVSFITATQNGKTSLVYDLLCYTDTSWCRIPPTMIVAKPLDAVVATGLDALGYEEVDRWPPPKHWFDDPPPGYGLWPKHLQDADEERNNAHLAGIIKPAVRDLFWRGNTICIADEIYHLCALLDMSPQMTRHWTQGHGMGAGLWSATQKPSGTQQGTVPSFMYNSQTHTFLGRELDERNRRRLNEISGIDSGLAADIVKGLKKYEWLYIHRDGPAMCVIEAGEVEHLRLAHSLAHS